MNKRSNDFIVGLTILVGAATVLVATLWVQQSDFRHKRNEVTARFRDVGNVHVGAPVVLRGVSAGRVQAIELAPDGWVDVRLGLDANVSLPRDPVVLLNESSLFGEWQATLTELSAVPRDEDLMAQLVAVRRSGTKAIPGATLPDIAQLTAVAGRIAGDVANVAQRFEVAFDEEAARELRSSIRNFSQLSATLAQTVKTQAGAFSDLSETLKTGMSSLSRASTAVEHVAVRLDSSTAGGAIHGIVTDVAEAAQQLKQTSADLHAMATDLGRSQRTFQSIVARGDSVMTKINAGQGSLGLLVNDARLYHNSDSLVTQLRQLVADIQRNPKKYVNVRIF